MKFERCKDILDFVEKWLFIYGKPKCPGAKQSFVMRWKDEFFNAFGLQSNKILSYSALPTSENTASTVSSNSKTPPHVSIEMQSHDTANECKAAPIFEILRIRNRMHLDLQDVPGGYRDFALKIKIGFFRYCFLLICCACSMTHLYIGTLSHREFKLFHSSSGKTKIFASSFSSLKYSYCWVD